MNVSPVQQSFPAESNTLDSGKEASVPASQRPSSEGYPIKEFPRPASSASGPEIVQDEVKLQWDSSEHLRIYQFVNQQSGALILQIPSEEVLGVVRGIHDSFEQEAARQEAAAARVAEDQGGKTDGH